VQKGDILFLSGETGLSRAGLELLLMNKKRYEKFEKELIKKHIEPIARIDLQKTVEKYANSCIDISDGLAGDLNHISNISSVKIVIDKEKIPINPLLEKYCKKYGKNPYDYILYGGEDYQLTFTASNSKEKYIKNCYKIGYIEKGKGIYLKEGKKLKKVKPKGFEHL